jgi:uncharacterized protein (DUF111 family)
MTAVGTGAGTKDFPAHPNILRLLIGEPATSSIEESRTVTVLETALDDANPQYLAATVQALLAAGARDAMVAPVTMKKGRSGFWLVVVAEPADARRLADLILRETPTIGVRMREERRIELPRRAVEVATEYGTVALKVVVLPSGEERAMPEFESVHAIALRSGATHPDIAAAAIRTYHETGIGS